jgi:hypothetical protein
VGLFKKKVVKEIDGGVWGCLFNVHHIDVNTLSREIRCVEREESIPGGPPVTFVRIFSLKKTEGNGITVTGWETFDTRPDLILFEGYVTAKNEAFIERKMR